MRRVYKYRLYPTRAQAVAMVGILDMLRHLYNAALQERRDAFRLRGLSIKKGDQEKQLKAIREDDPAYKAIHFHLLQDVTKRLDLAFQSFFRRLRNGEEPGYPRFKGRGRYRTFTFKDVVNRNGAALVSGGKRIRLAGVGNVRVRLHREFEGVVKQVSVTRTGYDHWYVSFVCDDVPAKPLPPTGETVGIDVGISTYAALSNGEMVENPRYRERAGKDVARLQRRVARRKKRSNRRRKAVRLLAKARDCERRRRTDFQHKLAFGIVRRFDVIAVEDLNIKGLAKSKLAKQVNDAAWGAFLSILEDKAESAGREVVRVDPRGTSQECSSCGREVRKSLAIRTHRCPHCGLVLDRDVNAARVILSRAGQALRGGDREVA